MIDCYGSLRNYLNEVYIIPAISIGVDYSYIMDLTPFSLMPIIKGLQKKIEREQQQRDSENYVLAIYILSGISGNFPKEPFSLSGSNKEKDSIDSKKEQYEKMKRDFAVRLIQMQNKKK